MFLNILGIGKKTIRSLVCNENVDSDNISIDNDLNRNNIAAILGNPQSVKTVSERRV